MPVVYLNDQYSRIRAAKAARIRDGTDSTNATAPAAALGARSLLGGAGCRRAASLVCGEDSDHVLWGCEHPENVPWCELIDYKIINR